MVDLYLVFYRIVSWVQVTLQNVTAKVSLTFSALPGEVMQPKQGESLVK